jgi:type IV secretory pathway TrbD component
VLEEHPIHPSINRVHQLLGGDRELVVLSGIIVCLVGLSLGTFWGFLAMVPIWFGLLWILQRMGKSDPLMRRVYIRHTRYGAYYPAKSGLYSQSPPLPPVWRR